jgi:hypothetical protein
MTEERKIINFNGRFLAEPMTEAEIRAELEAGRPLKYARATIVERLKAAGINADILSEVVSKMMRQKSDHMEMCYIHEGKRINVELRITNIDG